MILKNRLWPFFFFVFLWLPSFVPAAEYRDGKIRLVIDENTGRFSLYPADGGKNIPALFSDEDSRASFLSVMVNDRSYKMGDSSVFKIRVDENDRNPSLVFESSFLRVVEEFSFIKNSGGGEVNGVAVTITVENLGNLRIDSGARFLIDTNLGEGRSGPVFSTNSGTFNTETLVTASDGQNFWIDKNDTFSLAGSLYTGAPGDPDSVHFANWQKLSGASWKAKVSRGGKFDLLPYSVGDAAVCYYYEPRPLSPGEKRSFGFSLALNNEDGFVYPSPAAEQTLELPEKITPDPAIASLREKDLAAIKELMTRIDANIAAGTVTDEELAAIESALNEFRTKYGVEADVR
jgi:hypothetical protein